MFFGLRSVFHKRKAVKIKAPATARKTIMFCMGCLQLRLRSSVLEANFCLPELVGLWASGRSYQDIGCSGCVEADSAVVDFDHALLPSPFTEEFNFRAWEHSQVRHFGTGAPVAIDGANSHSAVAAGLGQRCSCRYRTRGTFPASLALGCDIAEREAGGIGVILCHEQ